MVAAEAPLGLWVRGHWHPGAPNLSSLSQLILSLEFVEFCLGEQVGRGREDLTTCIPHPFLAPSGGGNGGVHLHAYNCNK